MGGHLSDSGIHRLTFTNICPLIRNNVLLPDELPQFEYHMSDPETTKLVPRTQGGNMKRLTHLGTGA